MPEQEIEITYEVQYQNERYSSTNMEDHWFIGTPPPGHDEHSLAEAMQLAADFRAGVRHPRGAGKPVIKKTRIIQRVTVGTVILSDGPSGLGEEDPGPDAISVTIREVPGGWIACQDDDRSKVVAEAITFYALEGRLAKLTTPVHVVATLMTGED